MPQFKRPLPSEHAEQRTTLEKASQEREAVQERAEQRKLAAVEAILKTESGRVLWAWLHDRCGWVRPVLMRKADGDIAGVTTECLAAQREIYRELRKLAPPELLAKAEFEAEFGTPIDASKKTAQTDGEKK